MRAFRFYVGGHGWFFGVLNSFVHFIMYGYYFGSVYRPELKQNTLIKKSITQLQMVSGWAQVWRAFLLIAFVSGPIHADNHASVHSAVRPRLHISDHVARYRDHPERHHAVLVLRFLLQHVHQTE